MLLRVIFENFLSFDSAQEFNLFPNPRREGLSNHVYTTGKVHLLKQAAIYGNNAAGKSNLVKGLYFIQQFATKQNFLNENEIGKKRFRLAKIEDQENKPIELLIEFEANGKYFIYDIAVSEQGVDKEILYLSGIGVTENTVLFNRSFSEVAIGENSPKEMKSRWKLLRSTYQSLLSQNKFSSLLSLLKAFPAFNMPDIDIAYNWLANTLKVIRMHSTLPQLILLLQKESRIFDFTNKMMQDLQVGISSIEMQTSDLEEWMKRHTNMITQEQISDIGDGEALSLNSPGCPVFSITNENNVRKIHELLFKQIGRDNKSYQLEAEDQSDGTIRLLTLLPAFYAAIKETRTIVIDEINYCLHPMLIKGLTQYFAKEETKGQLIFTTHEVELMDQNNIMRPDEVWMVEKRNGSSHLYSLNEFKLHNTLSLSRGYREGRYGATFNGHIGNEMNYEA
jgi:transporter